MSLLCSHGTVITAFWSEARFRSAPSWESTEAELNPVLRFRSSWNCSVIYFSVLSQNSAYY